MPESDVTLRDVYLARRRIAALARRTPLVDSARLSEATGGQVMLKLENLQQTGAFKIRGAANKLLSLSEVNSVDRSGYLQEEIQIKVMPEKLVQMDIPFNSVLAEIRKNHVRQPAGTMEDEDESLKQYRKYVDSEHGYRIGKPGFWSFRGSGLDGRAIYYAIHSEKLPLDILNKLYDIEKYGVTLGDPNNWSLPEGVCMVFCDIDDCCLEVFVNESWMYDALEQYYKTNDLNAEVWKPEEKNDREDV